jgi:hypothetical protein
LVRISADGKPGADKPRRGPKPQGSDSQKSTPAAVTATPDEPAAEPVVAEVSEVTETPVVQTPENVVTEAPVVTEAASPAEQAE